jgi:hypothetical protein
MSASCRHLGFDHDPDGGRNYRVTLPADIPESRFWSDKSWRPSEIEVEV